MTMSRAPYAACQERGTFAEDQKNMALGIQDTAIADIVQSLYNIYYYNMYIYIYVYIYIYYKMYIYIYSFMMMIIYICIYIYIYIYVLYYI